MMRKIITILGFSVLFVSGCSDVSHYPLSEEQCGPDDPVKDMSANDLALPCAGQ